MSPETDRARSLNRRLANAARESSIDVQRVRRQLAFHRLLARVAETGWVLKGGYCLEARLPGQSRATKDIDFVRPSPAPGDDLLDELDALFAASAIDDGFAFQALAAKHLRAQGDPAPAWRLNVDCTVDGRRFDRLTLDVVAQFAEVCLRRRRHGIPAISGSSMTSTSASAPRPQPSNASVPCTAPRSWKTRGSDPRLT